MRRSGADAPSGPQIHPAAKDLSVPLSHAPLLSHSPSTPPDFLSSPPLHQTRHTVSGIAITGLGLAGSAVSTVRALLGGARPFNGTAAIPAANLAFLDLSGNALTGGVPAIPVPVLHVNLSSNRLSGDLQNQLKNNLTAAAFTATLVLDLSNNGFTGQLPTRIDVAAPATNSSAWGALLTSAVRIDFSGNGFTGSLPADWAPLLAQMDLVVSRNPGLTGGVPAEWIAAARGLPPCGDGGSGPFSLGSLITATAPPPSSPPSPAPGGGEAALGDSASSNPPRQGALLIDLSGCTGLTGRFTHTADFSTLRVRACCACVRACGCTAFVLLYVLVVSVRMRRTFGATYPVLLHRHQRNLRARIDHMHPCSQPCLTHMHSPMHAPHAPHAGPRHAAAAGLEQASRGGAQVDLRGGSRRSRPHGL